MSQSAPRPSDRQRWFSATELAAERLPSLPASRENAARFIARCAATNPEAVRPRAGRGGGFEVSVEALPAPARADLRRRAQLKAGRPAARADLFDLAGGADAVEHDKRQIAVRAIGHLTARQRQVMDARQALLLAVEAAALAAGAGKDRAIRDLVARAKAGTLDETRVAIVARANDKGQRARLSRATLYDWFARREAGGVAALAPELTREKQDLPAWFDAFLACYGRPSKPSIAEALREFNRSLPPGTALPTEAQVRRALKKMPQLERLKGREGKLALRARQAYAVRDFVDLLPTSVYVGDGKTFDAEVAHPIHGGPFRPELTTIVDVATRRVVGWSAALDESTHAVVDALRRASAEAGIPAIFYTDRGPGYRNAAMDATLTGFLARAGITAMRALPYNSQAKGVVERINQIYTATAKAMPTYIGRDMDKEAKLVAFRTTRREIAQIGRSRLLPGWDAFLDAIADAIAAYNDRPHSSLPKIRDPQLCRVRHMSPNEVWAAKSEGFEPVIPDAAELDEMFRPHVVRRTRRALVDWLGNSYFAAALEPFDGRDVIVGYDIRDASRVWVREIDDVDGERAPGRLIAVATFEGHKTRYVPLSAEQAAMEKRAKGRLGRLQNKMAVVEQELRPAAILELRPAAPAIETLPPESPVPRAPEAALPACAAVSGDVDRRPLFRDDVAFASWIAARPERATPSDIALIADLLTTPSSNEVLRMSGVDLEALRSIARTARSSGAGTGSV